MNRAHAINFEGANVVSVLTGYNAEPSTSLLLLMTASCNVLGAFMARGCRPCFPVFALDSSSWLPVLG